MFGPQQKYYETHSLPETTAHFLRALSNAVVEMQRWGAVWLQLFGGWPCMKHNHWQSIRGEKNISVLARNIACEGILKAYLLIENIQSILKVFYILFHWIGFLCNLKSKKQIKKKKGSVFFQEPRSLTVLPEQRSPQTLQLQGSPWEDIPTWCSFLPLLADIFSDQGVYCHMHTGYIVLVFLCH